VGGERTSKLLIQKEFTESVPATSPNGRWITYKANPSGRFDIYMVRFGASATDARAPDELTLGQNWFQELQRLVPTN